MVDTTGIGIGGSGGVIRSKVESAVIDAHGHLLPFEVPRECAAVISKYLNMHVGERDRSSPGLLSFAAGTRQLSDTWYEHAGQVVDAIIARKGNGNKL